MDRKRRIFILYCTIFSVALVLMIVTITFIVDGTFDSSSDKSISSHAEYNTDRYSGNGIPPESRWKMKHHHDNFQFSNGMYARKNDENYLIIDDVNIFQIDVEKREKVKEVNFLLRHRFCDIWNLLYCIRV